MPTPLMGALGLWLISVGASCAVSMVTFWGIGGLAHWWFYVRRRGEAVRWKVQPERWLTRERGRQAMWLGTVNVLAGAIVGGTIAWHVQRGGYSALYFDVNKYGIPYLPVSGVLAVALMDAGLYYSHRALHHPVLFRHIHRLHHLYVAPTVFTTLAMHPIELCTFMAMVFLPVFVLPMHPAVFIAALYYTYFIGMIDHSGVRIAWRLPFHDLPGFHDDHHIHVRCNYGHHTTLFDRLHGTVWKPPASDVASGETVTE